MPTGDDVLKEFLVESYENLDRLDRELVELEQRPDAKEVLSSIFRTIHTIKGTSGFFGFTKLGELTHVGENLLSKMRDGELRIDNDIASALLQMVDAVRQMLRSIEESHDEGDGDYGAITARLAELQTRPPPPRLGEILVGRGKVAAAEVEAALQAQKAGDPRKLGTILVEDMKVSPAVVGAAILTQQKVERAAAPADGASPDGHGGSVADGSIRVDTVLLDKLMNLAGELVLARNQILQFSSRLQDPAFSATCQRLNLITSEMQEGVMRTRMQPIGNVLAKLPRIVRDLAVACGKQVRVEIEGKETDLDRTVLEAIKDPLTHIIRNAVDHGIERPEVRSAAGKPAEGTLRVRAFHEGGQVNIVIEDDGGGIDPERVKRKALERGLVSAADASKLGERELINLIFLPGFSTADKITNVSGRGVGMDVVRTNVQNIGGTVEVQSRPGAGTTLRIKIPLTLAIIPALIVTASGDRYAIPQVNVLELVRLGGDGERGIEHIHGAPVYRLRGNLLPLVHLDETLEGERRPRDGAVNIVVLSADSRTFGLVVHEVNDTEEIVVKPLGRRMKDVGPFAGATILGDGRVALILDVRTVAHAARVIGDRGDRAAAVAAAAAEDTRLQTMLVLRVGAEGRVAVRLDEVARLEEFARDRVERAGDREVVQYRGRILPLVRVADRLHLGGGDDASRPLQVVVHRDAAGNSVGLVVDRILDVVREPVELGSRGRLPGVLGSAVIQKRVTELLDVPALRAAAVGE